MKRCQKWLRNLSFIIFIVVMDLLWLLFQLQFGVAAACLCSGWCRTSEIVFKLGYTVHPGITSIQKMIGFSARPVQWPGSAKASRCKPPPESLQSPLLCPHRDTDPESPLNPSRARYWLLTNIPDKEKKGKTFKKATDLSLNQTDTNWVLPFT